LDSGAAIKNDLQSPGIEHELSSHDQKYFNPRGQNKSGLNYGRPPASPKDVSNKKPAEREIWRYGQIHAIFLSALSALSH
jgi:hypothetical protein